MRSEAGGAHVYIVKCSDGAFYTGLTRRSPVERESEHNQGLDLRSWTLSRRPVVLVWSAHFVRIDEAAATERQIKGWTRRKKEALIRGDHTRLTELAKRRSQSSQ